VARKVRYRALERPFQRLARLGDQPRLFRIGDVELVHLRLEVGEHRRVGAGSERRAGEHTTSIGADRLEVEARRDDPHCRLPPHIGGDLVHHALDFT
jgi:hypothetical protein